jgi:hypothetical protein
VLDTEGGWGRGRQWQRAHREAGSRSVAAAVACSKGGRIKVDSGSVTMTKSLRKRTVAACSEAGVKAVVCSRVGDEASACSGARVEDGRWR